MVYFSRRFEHTVIQAARYIIYWHRICDRVRGARRAWPESRPGGRRIEGGHRSSLGLAVLGRNGSLGHLGVESIRACLPTKRRKLSG